MPKLGLGNASSSGSSMITPGIITDSLVMKHMYPAGAVQPLSDGAAYFGVHTDDDHIECGTTELNPNSITISAWVNHGGTVQSQGYARIIDADGDSKSWHLRYDTSGNRFVSRFSDDGTNHELCQSDSSYTDYSKWHHIATTYDASSGDCKMYVDGVHDGTDNLSGAGNLNVPSTPTVRIGQEANSTSNNWEGYICNVGVWGRVLTQAEIKSIMWKQHADLTTSESASLISWWNLDDTSIASQHEYNVTIDSVGTLGSELFHSPLTLSNFAAQGNNTIEFDSSNDNALKITYVDDDDGVKFYLSNSGGTYRVLTDNPVSGDVYKFTFPAKSNITVTNTYLRTSSDTNYKVHLINNSDWQEYTIYHKCQSTTGDFFRMMNLSSAEIVWMKDFSFKRLSGNHGTPT
jgi:hypothetical protein